MQIVGELDSVDSLRRGAERAALWDRRKRAELQRVHRQQAQQANDSRRQRQADVSWYKVGHA